METVDIIRDIVEALSFEEPVISTTDDGGDKFTFRVCNSRHLTACNIVELSGNKYEILSITRVEDPADSGDFFKDIQVEDREGAGDPGITTFPIAAPKFAHGTAVDVNNEVINEPSPSVVFPLVYLKEPFRESYSDDPEDAIDREAEVFLFALDKINYSDWITDDHHNNVLKPMESLIRELKRRFEASGEIGEFRNSQTEGYVNFGIIQNKGPKSNEVKEKIFDEFCSGVGLRITLPICKCLKCCDICNC